MTGISGTRQPATLPPARLSDPFSRTNVARRGRATPIAQRHSNNQKFKPGNRVLVYRVGSECPLIEGIATVIWALPGYPEFYLVRFDGERTCCIRPVHKGDWQQDPSNHLRRLIASWRFAAAPELFANHSFEGANHDTP